MTTIKQRDLRLPRDHTTNAPATPLPFGPDREDHLIAKALYVAQKAILADRQPAYSDAREMMEILEIRYPNNLWVLRHTENLKKAIGLGFMLKAGQPIEDQELIDFIKMHETEASRFELLEPPTFD